jgi:hypothetical protein
MRLGSSVTVALCSLLFAAVASAQDGSKKGGKPPPAKADVSKCVSVRTEAIYGAYGYDHHVHVHNGCDKAVRCEVTTNSNPEVTTVILGKGQSQDVVMFRGSPAREVSANTKCSAIDDA